MHWFLDSNEVAFRVYRLGFEQPQLLVKAVLQAMLRSVEPVSIICW